MYCRAVTELAERTDRARVWVRDAERIVVLTGAGISTDSGIPDFRGPQGVWTKNPTAEKTSTLQNYLADPAVRRMAWQMRLASPAWDAQPNDGHRAIVEIERQDKLIGARHAEHRRAAPARRQRPGARDRGPRDDVVDPLLDVRRPPADGRGARPRPSGRGRSRLPVCRERGATGSSRATRSRSGSRSCKRSSTGRSRSVRRATCCSRSARRSACTRPPAACRSQARSGAKVIVVNGSPTEMDLVADEVLRGQISEILPALVSPTLPA